MLVLSSLLACCPAAETARADMSVFRAVLRAREGDVLELQSNGQRLQLQLSANTAIVAADGRRLSAEALPLAAQLYVRAWPQGRFWQAEEVRLLD